MTAKNHRSGFVAVVGKPNVGKSTLVNALVGHKISIVTSKPHTTRHAILGVLTEPEHQVVFIDTPGLEQKQRTLMNRSMNRAALGALDGATIIMLVVQAGESQAKIRMQAILGDQTTQRVHHVNFVAGELVEDELHGGPFPVWVYPVAAAALLLFAVPMIVRARKRAVKHRQALQRTAEPGRRRKRKKKRKR